MNTSTPTQNFTVSILIDKTAALLAGNDEYGPRSVVIKPSQLSPKQRETLAALNYEIKSGDVGAPISGLEALDDLLNRAAALRESRQEKIDEENNQCLAEMLDKIAKAPLADRLSIDEQTGQVTIEHLDNALLSLNATSVKKNWTDRYYGGLWLTPAFGSDRRATELRAAVLNNPDVAPKIQLAEQKAECLQRKLDAAKLKREALSTEQKAKKDRLRLEAETARKNQLDTFVVNHMSELQKARYAAGLMADGEILGAIEAEVFKPLDRKIPAPEFPRYTPPRAADIIAYVEAELGKEIYSEEVSYDERPLSSATDAEFLQIEKIKKLMPGAEVVPLQHFAYCDDYNGSYDPELAVNVCRITIQSGALEFSRDYLLNEVSNNGN